MSACMPARVPEPRKCQDHAVSRPVSKRAPRKGLQTKSCGKRCPLWCPLWRRLVPTMVPTEGPENTTRTKHRGPFFAECFAFSFNLLFSGHHSGHHCGRFSGHLSGHHSGPSGEHQWLVPKGDIDLPDQVHHLPLQHVCISVIIQSHIVGLAVFCWPFWCCNFSSTAVRWSGWCSAYWLRVPTSCVHDGVRSVWATHSMFGDQPDVEGVYLVSGHCRD